MQVGPKIIPNFGFDIVILKGRAIFSMELCEQADFSNIEKVSSELLENLRAMYSINLVHLDIKPANISYSPLFQKHIFLDFGLSLILT